MTDAARPLGAVTSLADDVPDAPTPHAAPAALPTLADFLPDLARERDPSEAGGVPLPEAWQCFRAALEGASRRDLESAHRPRATLPRQENDNREAFDRVQRLAKEGTHLPAGLHILTGQTGGAKTAFSLNLAHAALEAGHPVLYISMELDAVELAARVVGLALDNGDATAPVTWWQLARRRRLSPEGQAARSKGIAAVRDIAERMAVKVATEALDVRTLYAHALHLWRRWGKVPLVVFDYLQAAGIGGDEFAPSLRQHIASIALTLRRLSQENSSETYDGTAWPGCPVLVQSITARNNVRGDGAVEGMNGERPDNLRWADLETLKALPKEAGEVEATAVTAWVMALEDTPDARPRALTLRLAKYRGGLAGQWIPFTFDGRTQRVTEAPDRYAEAMKDDASKSNGTGR